MWIIPNNYQHYSAFAQDMVVSKEDLSELSESLESSLMLKSKPSPLRTWLRRWNQVPWLRRLSGRMLKPSRWKPFEEKLTSSLPDTLASHLVLPAKEKERKTHGTYGLTSQGQYQLFAQESLFSKTWKDTSPWACGKSLPTWLASDTEWKMIVENQRGEYSRRLKLARLTREKECLSWRTPRVPTGGLPKSGYKIRPSGNHVQEELGRQVLDWQPAQYGHQDQESSNIAGKSREQSNWSTPEAANHMGYHNQANGDKILKLGSQVVSVEKQSNWLTPKTPSGGGQAVRTTPGGGLRKLEDQTEPMDRSAKLNPDWVEQLMGLPVGTTQIVSCSGTGENRIDMLRLLGNGVVPQTAEKAIRTLLWR